MTVSSGGQRVAAFVLSRRFTVLWAALTALYLYGWATKWTFDPWTIGKFWPGHFYSAQADAILHGRLWIDETYLPNECSYADGRCYGYFGIVPSLLRIPLVVVLGIEDSELAPVFIAAAAAVVVWAGLDLCRRVLLRAVPSGGRPAAAYLAVAAVVLGPGSVLLLLTDPYVYQEAILWSIAGVMVAVGLFWRWWSEGRRWQFVGAIAALVFGAGARPTVMFVGLVLALGVVVGRWIAGRLSWRLFLASVALALLPMVFAGGVLYAKFGALSSPMSEYELADSANLRYIVRNVGDDKTTSLRYVPTALYAYLRPDAMRLSSDWPWFRIRFGWPFGNYPYERITFLPPLPKDSMYVERTVSMTDVMPLAMLATAIAFVIVIVRRRVYELLILLALCTPIFVVLTSFGMTSRYLGDAYPLVAVGTAFGASVVPWYARRSSATRVVIAVPVVALAVLSVIVVGSLTTQYAWIQYLGIQ